MAESFRNFVFLRAQGRCEYCHLPQTGHEERFSVDHIIPRKHRVDDTANNLALSCLRCNLYKGTNLSGIDPTNGKIVSLFHPREEIWLEHFGWNGPIIIGLTPTGRATVNVMKMNAAERINLRQILMTLGILTVD